MLCSVFPVWCNFTLLMIWCSQRSARWRTFSRGIMALTITKQKKRWTKPFVALTILSSISTILLLRVIYSPWKYGDGCKMWDSAQKLKPKPQINWIQYVLIFYKRNIISYRLEKRNKQIVENLPKSSLVNLSPAHAFEWGIQISQQDFSAS